MAECERRRRVRRIRSRTRLTREVLERAPKLVGIGAFCIGTNQIDLDFAAKRGHSGLQRAVLEHAQRRRTGDLRDHHADARHPGEKRGAPSRRLTKSAANSVRKSAARRSASSATATSARRSACLANKLGMNVVFQDIEAKLALATRVHSRRSTNCSRYPTSSACTSRNAADRESLRRAAHRDDENRAAS